MDEVDQLFSKIDDVRKWFKDYFDHRSHEISAARKLQKYIDDDSE